MTAALFLLGAWTGSGGAQTPAERLSVHGFMTQAYGLTDQHQILGLGPDGTADYRVAALQFRYALDTNSAFVIQLSHERLGRSPQALAIPAVDLDWVFYEHSFDDYTVGRIGKVRMPIGIYNEIRDVGTLLPFYRPPAAMYSEQLYTNETLDGVTLGRRVPIGAWEMSIDGFVGSWEFVQYGVAAVAKVDAGYGVNVWLQTPLEGLRVGGAAVRYTVRDLIMVPPGTEDTQVLLRAQLDGRFGRLGARGELQHVDFGKTSIGYDGTSKNYYGEATVDVTERLTLMAQAQWWDLLVDAPVLGISLDENIDRDFAVGARYSLTPSLVLKLEGHRFRGHSIDDVPFMPWVNAPANVDYALLSLSASF